MKEGLVTQEEAGLAADLGAVEELLGRTGEELEGLGPVEEKGESPTLPNIPLGRFVRVCSSI